MSKWTIGIVNYHSSVYIKWQLKILYEFNNQDDFSVIIVDNSKNDKEFQLLTNISKDYQGLYGNIKLIQNTPSCEDASGQHGEGLDIIRKLTNSKYLITQDPDFFWLKPQYLQWLESLLQYNDAVGIPYPKRIAEGQENFPGAFGCAYVFDKIKDISFKPYVNNDMKISWERHKSYSGQGYCFSHDVGWRVRKGLSRQNDYNFISFNQININKYLDSVIDYDAPYSFETLATIYRHNESIVACHLFRGTFTGGVKGGKDTGCGISESLFVVRNKIAKFMYNEMLEGNPNLNLVKKLYTVGRFNEIYQYNSKFLFWSFIYLIKKARFIKVFVPISAKIIRKKIQTNAN